MTASSGDKALVQSRQEGIVLESPAINRGLHVLEETEPVLVFPTAVLQYGLNLIIIEEASTNIIREGQPDECVEHRDFCAHFIRIEDGVYERTIRCSLSDLIGLRDEHGQVPTRDYLIVEDKLLVHEDIYHGKAFAEHVFDLAGKLLCILTDDKELGRRNRHLLTAVLPVPEDDGERWTLALGRGHKRFAELKVRYPYARRESPGYSHIFYDRMALLQKLRLKQPYTDEWPTPFEVITKGSVIPDNQGIWKLEGDGSVCFIPIGGSAPQIQQAIKGTVGKTDPGSIAVCRYGGEFETLISEIQLSNSDTPQPTKGPVELHRYTYCYIRDQRILVCPAIQLPELLQEYDEFAGKEIDLIHNVSILDGKLVFSVVSRGKGDKPQYWSIGVVNVADLTMQVFDPLVPWNRTTKASFPTIVDTEDDRVVEFTPDTHSHFIRRGIIYRIGDVIPT